mmetsp:Transcript_54793/g.142649  ORF Transcript_54793/g.142649 Transcript_54793/m.142649 type:complete len:228 (-) Transcript_54793:508-1191(-)
MHRALVVILDGVELGGRRMLFRVWRLRGPRLGLLRVRVRVLLRLLQRGLEPAPAAVAQQRRGQRLEVAHQRDPEVRASRARGGSSPAVVRLLRRPRRQRRRVGRPDAPRLAVVPLGVQVVARTPLLLLLLGTPVVAHAVHVRSRGGGASRHDLVEELRQLLDRGRGGAVEVRGHGGHLRPGAAAGRGRPARRGGRRRPCYTQPLSTVLFCAGCGCGRPRRTSGGRPH